MKILYPLFVVANLLLYYTRPPPIPEDPTLVLRVTICLITCYAFYWFMRLEDRKGNSPGLRDGAVRGAAWFVAVVFAAEAMNVIRMFF